MTNTIDVLQESSTSYRAPYPFRANANVADPDIYDKAQLDPEDFWEDRARELAWFEPWHTPLEWKRPNAKWFVGGKLNASLNCLDVHMVTQRKHKAAIIWEGENGHTRTFTYSQLYREVCKLSHALVQQFNIKKGDRVTLYMPLIPELVVAVLACARIGAIHSVVFAGFSANSLRDRIEDSESTLLITADGGNRRGKVIELKNIVDEALSGSTPIRQTIVVEHVGPAANASYTAGRDVTYDSVMDEGFHYWDAEEMDSEDPLFILYTSGTTGKPKGIVHSTGGYMTHAKYSTRAVFDLKDDDVYWCTADIGWITGHTYLIYGPLSNGATCVMYEGTPDYPNKDRFWEIVEKHAVSILYTAPTAIRAFMKWGESHTQKHDLSSLRLLGTVGEPINPEAWEWFYKHIGNRQCPIVDTWWQTETGGILITNLPALNDMKPGYAGLPLPGISAAILDDNGNEVSEGAGYLSITQPWPSMARGIWGDEARFKEVYWSRFDSYFAGDGATKDQDGYYKVVGRVDDVLNVSGHRIGTAEVESALVEHPAVAEAAVVGIADDLTGQAIKAYVILTEGQQPSSTLEQELITFVGQQIGKIAKPKHLNFTPDLPKTRSGKIMRRVLKGIANNTEIGDTTTLANPDIVETLKATTTTPA